MRKVKKIFSLVLVLCLLGSTFAYADADVDETAAENVGAALVVITEAPAETTGEAPAETTGEAPAETTEEAPAEQVGNGSKSGADTVSSVLGEHSQKTIVIDPASIEVSKVETNQNYYSLSFSFTCEEDAAVYDAFITGLNISYQADTDFNYVVAMVRDIADSFYADQSITLSDSTDFAEKYNLTVCAIDAEKIHDTGSLPYSDADLCWAASASDMLQFTGWASAADAEQFKSEDDILAYFEKSFTDAGSSQNYGTKWFFNGVNEKQKTDDIGNVIYGEPADFSQECAYTDTKSGALIPDYAEESLEQTSYVSDDGIDPLYDAAMGLKDGKAVGLGIYFYDADNNYTNNGHAITLFGFIKNALEEGVNSLKALFITDSDNNKFDKDDRTDIVDSVTMYTLGDWSGKSGSHDVTTKELKGYGDDHTPILDFTVLEPCSGSTAEKETEGTKDAVNSIDFKPSYIAVEDSEEKLVSEAEVGEMWKLSAGIKNISYSPVTTPNGEEAYLRGSFIVSLNGRSIEIPVAVTLSDKGRDPLMSNYFVADYRFTEAGAYTVSFVLDGIYYEDAQGDEYRINEAYYNNNSSNMTYTINIKPTAGGDDGTAGTPADSAVYETVCGYEADFRYSENADIYTVKLYLPSGGSYILVMDGKPLDVSAYTVTDNSDGSFTVSFAPEFIKSVAPGSSRIIVRNETGETAAVIILTVR